MRRRGGEEREDEKETMIIPPPPSQCFACFRKNAGLRRTSGEGEQFKLHRMASSQFPSLLHVYVASLLLLFRKGGSGGLPTHPSSPTISLPFPPLSFANCCRLGGEMANCSVKVLPAAAEKNRYDALGEEEG